VMSLFLIRGLAAKNENNLPSCRIASDDQIDEFLGYTGHVLAPKEWRKDLH
jgi:hypothetical protein